MGLPERIFISLLLLGLSGMMTWKIQQSLRTGVFAFRGRATRAKQPVWFWLQIFFCALFVVYALWFILWIFWPDHVPAPALPCNPRFASTCK